MRLGHPFIEAVTNKIEISFLNDYSLKYFPENCYENQQGIINLMNKLKSQAETLKKIPLVTKIQQELSRIG